MAVLTDKEQKKVFKKIASQHPEQYYPVKSLKKNGFHRAQCTICHRFYWSAIVSEVCGEPTCNAGFQVVENNPTKHKLSYIGVWQKIVEILEPRGYKPIKRYPVVSRWNPTTEFTIASIAAFQPYVVTGEVPPPAKKLIIPQMCLRFGDIENVGITGSHCTAFVMIGQHQFLSREEWNQEQAFQDIYDFLVDGVGLANTEFKIHEDAWAGGGSFGPCLEFFSRGVELFNQVYTMFEQTPTGNVELKLKVLDMGLGMERVAWFSQGTPNMYEAVFPQVLHKIRERTQISLDLTLYNRFSQYSAYLNVDEVENMDDAWRRVGEALQIDPIELKAKILPMTGIYSVAEHSRALLFAISDGKLPSNVGGGYNLRVIFRRAMEFIDHFHWNLDLGEVCAWHAEELFDLFPEVSETLDEVKQVLQIEKEKYSATKQEAEKILKNLFKREAQIDEAKLIELYDSNGISPEIVKSTAATLGRKIIIPDDFFGKVIARHENIAQIHATNKPLDIEVDNLPETKRLYFDDYLLTENTAIVLSIQPIFHEMEDEMAEEVGVMKKFPAWAVIVDQSVAYPTSGGQLHDIGTIDKIPFVDVIKINQIIAHIVTESPPFHVHDEVLVKIDKKRRKLLTQHHSATHIVNAAARQVLGSHINQAGAKKTLNQAHLDITHFESISEENLNKIEQIANEIVEKGIDSSNRFMNRTEAEQEFGMRVYQGGAVPGVELRIVEIPGIDVEACGGTHVHNTSEVGKIKIIKSQKIQDGIVRLTFTAGTATTHFLKHYQQIKKQIAAILGCTSSQIAGRTYELLEKWKELRKAQQTGSFSSEILQLTSIKPDEGENLQRLARDFDVPIELLTAKIQKLHDEWFTMKQEIEKISQLVGDDNVQSLLKTVQTINQTRVVIAHFQGIDTNTLNNIGKNLLRKDKTIICLLITATNKNVSFITMKGIQAGNWNMVALIRPLLTKYRGKGGGKNDFAQGFIEHFPSRPEDLSIEFLNLLKK